MALQSTPKKNVLFTSLEVKMNNCINALVEYFKNEVPKLESRYSWKIPQFSDFESSGKSGYQQNIELKHHFNAKWQSSNTENKLALSKEVVADWGGVRGNKDETLTSYVNELIKEKPRTPLKGIASYSKIFSIVDMDRYAIYDARVAACLNAVQWNHGVSTGLAFNYISGRNNVVGNSINKSGFVYQEEFKVSSLVAAGWQRIKRSDTYQVYLDVLKQCLKSLPGYKLYDLEMVLFANAETECLKAMSA
ncbi:hypothetical protein ACJJIE_11385 [Microbulbifer sp. TRSA001]|uniref:hypothetical protein n=1 Tax=Microbulbifer sp. TRSA001 TaxID=3243381 RepID=UPI004039D014